MKKFEPLYEQQSWSAFCQQDNSRMLLSICHLVRNPYFEKHYHRSISHYCPSQSLYVCINEKEVNIYGSQGQNRTVILTLKLSELQVIYEEIGEYPILLLDDFMSELDEKKKK